MAVLTSSSSLPDRAPFMLILALMVLTFYFELIQIYRKIARMVKHPSPLQSTAQLLTFFVFVPSFLPYIYTYIYTTLYINRCRFSDSSETEFQI